MYRDKTTGIIARSHSEFTKLLKIKYYLDILLSILTNLKIKMQMKDPIG